MVSPFGACAVLICSPVLFTLSNVQAGDKLGLIWYQQAAILTRVQDSMTR